MTAALNIHPDRKTPRLKPLTALSRMRRLIADNEDTEQVFHIIEALNGRHLLSHLERFAETPAGAQRLAERRYLPTRLDDHAWIADLPEGTLGRAYLRFMERENLSAQGLVDESNKFYGQDFDDDLKWFGNRLRDTHDMFHVLTGYGRDALGEAVLLAFSWGQHGGRGVIFISFMGCRQLRKELPRDIDITACYEEAKRNGAAAEQILEQDILALMEQPLDEVRAKLNIAKPVAYQAAMAQIAAYTSENADLAAV
ncbi:MAG: Coq4 family protein [Pseudomonadota bacterium]